MNEKILILDFGGQYNQLIARRVREQNVYAEILPYTTKLTKIKKGNYKGIIFTGGPNSVFDEESPHYTADILSLGIPVLGICYGCQLMSWMLDGSVATAPVSEYGKITVINDIDSQLLSGVPKESVVWMSHTDYIDRVPEGFEIIAHTKDCPCAAMQNKDRNLYAVQYHPEVTHSEYGKVILKNFIKDICGCTGDWVMDSFIENTVAELKEKIGDKQVILGLSGGVDSSVAAALLSRAIGKQLTCVFVDQGLMRKDEGDFVEETFTKLFDMNFVRVNCEDEFLIKLKGITSPERKRKRIGSAFYARGKDYLFVMRRVNEPDTPFITLEFDLDGTLLLAKKLNNLDAKEKDEVEFIERFRLEALMPYINKQNNRNYINLLDEFCKEFAPYVADNWWENHLNIYIYLDEEPARIVCYGLDRANWLGISNSDYSFDESLQELISEVPTGTQEIYVQFTCGRMDKIKLRTE